MNWAFDPICRQIHACSSCFKPIYCQTYRWSCPWINEDEDQRCAECQLLDVEEQVEEDK